MSIEPIEKRRHLRHLVNEPCIAYHEDSEYIGAVVNMSVSGAAVHLDVALDANLESDTIVKLQVRRIGGVRTRVVHPRSAASRLSSCSTRSRTASSSTGCGRCSTSTRPVRAAPASPNIS